MPEQYSIAEARDRFAQLVHVVENGKPVQITRRGKPVVVVLSLSEYQRLISAKVEFGAALAKFRQKCQIQSLDIDPDEVFQDVRDHSFGREVSL